jgi:hypothetical protein
MAHKWYLHTLSGVVDRLDEHVAKHPTFAPYLVEVPFGTKSFEPNLYKPQTAAEYLASHKRTAEKDTEDKK